MAEPWSCCSAVAQSDGSSGTSLRHSRCGAITRSANPLGGPAGRGGDKGMPLARARSVSLKLRVSGIPLSPPRPAGPPNGFALLVIAPHRECRSEVPLLPSLCATAEQHDQGSAIPPEINPVTRTAVDLHLGCALPDRRDYWRCCRPRARRARPRQWRLLLHQGGRTTRRTGFGPIDRGIRRPRSYGAI